VYRRSPTGNNGIQGKLRRKKADKKKYSSESEKRISIWQEERTGKGRGGKEEQGGAPIFSVLAGKKRGSKHTDSIPGERRMLRLWTKIKKGVMLGERKGGGPLNKKKKGIAAILKRGSSSSKSGGVLGVHKGNSFLDMKQQGFLYSGDYLLPEAFLRKAGRRCIIYVDSKGTTV